HSLAQLRNLLTTSTPSGPSVSKKISKGNAGKLTSSAAGQSFDPVTSVSLPALAALQGSEDTAWDTDIEVEPAASPSPAGSGVDVGGKQTDRQEGAAEMYKSTIEFLALMTAFVTVVCWLMQTRISSNGTRKYGVHMDETRYEQTDTGAMTDFDMEGMDHIFQRPVTSGSSGLMEFLDLFDDRDNVLKPIKDALATSKHDAMDGGLERDVSSQVGLYAWHYYLFGSDRDGPLEREGRRVDTQALHLMHFDVILNGLYTTHVLSMTVKEHQKDHGQFYTPTGIVDFMWKRTIIGAENLLVRFIGKLKDTEDSSALRPDLVAEPLIPTAIDPCLGVSTFLSSYVRLLIREAQKDYALAAVWNSEPASRLLLHQICEHVWGIELDGFAFWMARCGVIAALMPLVQRVKELSQYPHYTSIQRQDAIKPPKLPRLHLFRGDTLQLKVPNGNTPEIQWERDCILRLRNPESLQFDYIVTNPPYMIRKTGTFSAPDPDVYDLSILGSSLVPLAGGAADVNSDSCGHPKFKQKARSGNYSLASMVDEGAGPAIDLDDDDVANDSEPELAMSESSTSTLSTISSRSGRAFPPMRPGAKGMMQAYGYFIWFGAQRIKPQTGVVCMITGELRYYASQWLTLEFAARLRAWLFDNCLLDEFFQFEPFKVFSKIQTDSLIFKIRAMGSQDPNTTQLHRTVFLRHTGHHKSLADILQDYENFSATDPSAPSQSDLDILVSSKTRAELQAVITASTAGSLATGSSVTINNPLPPSYSFAALMPSSELTTYLLTLTQDLGGICSAGTKRVNRLNATEPLLWHRGPNTNPVYGLVVRMEYARAMFGEAMSQRWFRPAFYWNGKNSPEGANSVSATSGVKTIHREADFWQGRDRLRLSKKEGSPAESYLVATPEAQRLYGLCMVDKESVRVLREQVRQGEDGSHALWTYLTDVRNHFQPGLVLKMKKVSTSGKQQAVEDEGVAFCSTSQCGYDVPEKIIHPINYGYFSKTQPRQRFFLDTSSLAVTNQCIYLTLNTLSRHYDAQQSPPLMYFLTLLNSSVLQFFVLHHCQYDQQGRMRLFRDSMAKIPFQNRDAKHHPAMTRYAAQLGEVMIALKEVLYELVSAWHLTGSHHGQGKATATAPAEGRGSRLKGQLAGGAGSVGGNYGLLDWIRRGGDAPTGVLARAREQILMMLTTRTQMVSGSSFQSGTVGGTGSDSALADRDIVTSIVSNSDVGAYMDIATRMVAQEQSYSTTMAWEGQGTSVSGADQVQGGVLQDHYTTKAQPASLSQDGMVSRECDGIMQAIERAITMVEAVQWAVDQYGYMLYGIRPNFQKLLELELKIVYGSRVESWVASSSYDTDSAASPLVPPAIVVGQFPEEAVASSPDNIIPGLRRWDGDYDGEASEVASTLDPEVPSYAQAILEGAHSSVQILRGLLRSYPRLPTK
ncbi:hypothetical protein BGX28_006424, partial [Mortierella sp. GBA30]